MSDLNDFLVKYAALKGKKVGVNAFVWSHNDMMDFADKYFEKKVNEYLEKEKIKLMGNT